MELITSIVGDDQARRQLSLRYHELQHSQDGHVRPMPASPALIAVPPVPPVNAATRDRRSASSSSRPTSGDPGASNRGCCGKGIMLPSISAALSVDGMSLQTTS